MIGLTAGLVIEGQTGKNIITQVNIGNAFVYMYLGPHITWPEIKDCVTAVNPGPTYVGIIACTQHTPNTKLI